MQEDCYSLRGEEIILRKGEQVIVTRTYDDGYEVKSKGKTGVINKECIILMEEPR